MTWRDLAAAQADWARDKAGDLGHRLSDAAVEALARTPRHLFTGAALPVAYALEERATPSLPEGQPVSQPVIVAMLADLVGAGPGKRILEIGTGSGYQAAVLTAMGAQVWSVEARPAVAAVGRDRLERAACGHVELRIGDGRHGWPEAAPFDGVLGTARFEQVPGPWVSQLAPSGMLVFPALDPSRPELPGAALLQAWSKTADGLALSFEMPCRFVPAVDG